MGSGRCCSVLGVGALLVVVAGEAQAAEPVESPPPVAGEAEQAAVAPVEVVVTAKRKVEDPFVSDRSVAVVGERQLSEQVPRTTPEALWDVPGVFVQQTNHGGGSPIVRGLIGPQVLMLVDGVRLNNSVYRTGPLQYLNLVDASLLGRVEVLRGPGSVLYGSDAMGGVIQMVPREPPDTRGQRGIEAQGASRLHYASASKMLGWHTRAGLGAQGFGVLGAATLKSLGDLRGGRGVGVQQHSGYSHHSGFGSLAYRFGDGPLDGWGTRASYLFSRIGGAGRTDKLVDKQSLQIYDNEAHLLYDRAQVEIDALRTTVKLTPSFQHFYERKDNYRVADDLVTRLSAVRDETRVNTFGLDGQLDTAIVVDRLAVRYGAMVYHDWVKAERFERDAGMTGWAPRQDSAYPSGSKYMHYGGFVMLDSAPLLSDGGHKLGLRGGYRLHGMAGEAPAQTGRPAADLSHLGHVFMGAAQYAYRDRASVAFSYAQGFRAPNLQEAVMLGDTGKFYHLPNDDLAPERSDTFELNARGKIDRFTLCWAGYVTLLDDLIKRSILETSVPPELNPDGKDVAMNVNADTGKLLGMEGAVAIDIGGGWSVNTQISYARGTEDLPDGGSEPLSRIPPLFGLNALRYDAPLPGMWQGFVESYIRWAANQSRLSPEDDNDARIPEGGTPAWWTWNARVGLAGRGQRMALAVENLLDVEYKYHGSGVFGAGTNAQLSYEASF